MTKQAPQTSRSRKRPFLCIYCGGVAGTSDHVPPKAFLERPFPTNLMTVPACRNCNVGFSLDEQYLLILLTQIGTRSSLLSKLDDDGVVTKTLMRAPKLDDRIVDSLTVAEDGRILIRPEVDRVNTVIRKIVAGLYFRRYRRPVPFAQVGPVAAFPYNIEDQRPVDIFIAAYSEKFIPKRWRHVQRGTFSYTTVMDPRADGRILFILDFHETLWGIASVPHPARLRRDPDTAQILLV